MTPEQFFERWAGHLPLRLRRRFLADLGALVAHEQARERRRLCTDEALYQRACADTAEEIRQYGVRDDTGGKVSA